MTATRLMIVEDHPVMRLGLQATLAAEPDFEVCGEAADAEEALALFRSARPGLAIIDVSLPSGSGLEVAKQMLAIDASVRILFVSMHEDSVFAERALQAGALGYIHKSRPGEELLAAVRQVAQGQVALSAKMRERLERRGLRAVGGGGSGVESLSDRELEVFELIGRGLGTREIAERLCLSIKTIETHRQHIKQKLNIESGTELSYHATVWLNSQR